MLSIAVIGYPRALRKSVPSGFLHKHCGYYSSKYGTSANKIQYWQGFPLKSLDRNLGFRYFLRLALRTVLMTEAPRKLIFLPGVADSKFDLNTKNTEIILFTCYNYFLLLYIKSAHVAFMPCCPDLKFYFL